LRSVSGWECPGNGEVGKTATLRVRRELTAQVADKLSTEARRLLHWTREVPAEVDPRYGGQFGCSQGNHMSCSVGAMRSPRPDSVGTRDDNPFPSLRGAKPRSNPDACTPTRSPRPPINRGPRDDSSFPSLRAKRGNLYINVDHSNPWCILHREGAGRSWAFSVTSNIYSR